MAKRTRTWLIGGGVAVVLVVGAIGIALASSGDDAAGSQPSSTRRTTEVTRRDLVESETFDGTLGYGEPAKIAATVPSAASDDADSGAGRDTPAADDDSSGSSGGVVTVVAGAGSTVERGGQLFRIDDALTVLLYGALPLYRDLSTASSAGADIRQVEENLEALGYDPGTVDETFTSTTASAVAAWEDDLGRADPDGVVQRGEIVFRPGAVRIATVDAGVGSPVSTGTDVLSVTGTTKLVTIDLPVDQQDLVQPGVAVKVQLPSGSTVDGVVYSVAATATIDDDSSDVPSGDGSTDPTLETIVVLDPGTDTGSLDEAPVDVDVQRTLATDALSVPVTALLALAEGGYGLEVLGPNGTTRFVAVDAGPFADSYVAVKGTGIDVGTKVVTA